MGEKYEPCSICEAYIKDVSCDNNNCPVAKMKAEIARQEEEIDYWKRNAFKGCMERGRIAETARSEAIKEFAERLELLKKFRSCMTTSEYELSVTMREVDTVKKEMLKRNGR